MTTWVSAYFSLFLIFSPLSTLFPSPFRGEGEGEGEVPQKSPSLYPSLGGEGEGKEAFPSSGGKKKGILSARGD